MSTAIITLDDRDPMQPVKVACHGWKYSGTATQDETRTHLASALLVEHAHILMSLPREELERRYEAMKTRNGDGSPYWATAYRLTAS